MRRILGRCAELSTSFLLPLRNRNSEQSLWRILSVLNFATSSRMPKNKVNTVPPKLTDAERDLLSQLQEGYQLETDSLGNDRVLRRLKDNEVLRPADANASIVKALRQRCLIRPGKAHDPLTIRWRLKTAKARPKKVKGR